MIVPAFRRGRNRPVRDYRDAITFAETLPETDVDRIGIWGSSYSGGHVLVVGAIDRRAWAGRCRIYSIDTRRRGQSESLRAAMDATLAVLATMPRCANPLTNS
jgi:cephalosporin-C deacetylase-like acetyl esterase